MELAQELAAAEASVAGVASVVAAEGAMVAVDDALGLSHAAGMRTASDVRQSRTLQLTCQLLAATQSWPHLSPSALVKPRLNQRLLAAPICPAPQS